MVGALPQSKSEPNREDVVRTPLRSSTVSSAGFARKSRILEIEFQSGAVYRYRGVPENVYAAFLAAESKGRYFGAHIRGKFAFEKVKSAKQ